MEGHQEAESVSPTELTFPTIEEIERTVSTRCKTCTRHERFDLHLFTCHHCQYNPLFNPKYDHYEAVSK